MRALLEVVEVSRAFGGLQALRGVSLSVRPGEIKALIGPNGAGKTTLFNIVTGTLAPDTGDVRLDGRSLVGLPPFRIAELGIARTFQNVHLFGGMTVLEHALVGLHRHLRSGLVDAAVRSRRMRQEERWARERAWSLLERFGLSTWAHAAADRLPFGLQRVVELVRAMATEPRLVLLDEPAAGLNPTEKERLADLIRSIRDEGVTVLLVEHDVDFVMELADEVAVLVQGVLIAAGPPGRVRSDPRVIAAYLGEEPVADHAS